MTREEFKKIAGKMNGNWKNVIDSQGTFDVWYDKLASYPGELIAAAVSMLMDTLTDYPKIGHIKAACVKLMTNPNDQLTPQEAWGYIERAIAKSGYYAQEAYDALPPILKKCTSPDQLYALSQDQNYNSTVESSNFFRTYNKLLEAEREFKQYDPSIQQLIMKTTAAVGIAENTTLGIEVM